MNKKTKIERRAERRAKRHYGMAKIKRGQKVCFISKQDKNGWSLGLAMNSHTRWIRNVRFASREEVERLTDGRIQFIPLKNEPEKKSGQKK